MDNDDNVIATIRQIISETMAKVSPLPPPEEVFTDWLMALPHDAYIDTAAAQEIAPIDRRNLLPPDLQCLRMLLVAVAGSIPWQRSAPNL